MVDQHKQQVEAEAKWIHECISRARKEKLTHSRAEDKACESAGESHAEMPADEHSKRLKKDTDDEASDHFADIDDEDASAADREDIPKPAIKTKAENSINVKRKNEQKASQAIDDALQRARVGTREVLENDKAQSRANAKAGALSTAEHA